MLPKAVLHKRNGSAHPADVQHMERADIVRLVHSASGPAPRPTAAGLEFARVAGTERATVLLEQAWREVDGVRSGLVEALQRTDDDMRAGGLGELRRLLAAVRRESDIIGELASPLVAAAEARAGARRVVDVNTVIADVAAVLRDRTRVTVLMRCGGDLPPVVGDPRELVRMLVALVGDAGDAGRLVTIESCRVAGVVRGEHVVRVTVVDSGGEPDGTGVAHAAEIATAHGGTIQVEPADDGGRRVTVDLPAV